MRIFGGCRVSFTVDSVVRATSSKFFRADSSLASLTIVEAESLSCDRGITEEL